MVLDWLRSRPLTLPASAASDTPCGPPHPPCGGSSALWVASTQGIEIALVPLAAWTAIMWWALAHLLRGRASDR